MKNLPNNSVNYNYVADMEHAEYWRQDRLPLKVFIHDSSAVKGYTPAYLDMLKAACNQWSAGCDNLFSFEFVDKLEGSDIEVRWTSDYKDWPIKADGHEQGVADLSVQLPHGVDHASIYLLTLRDGRPLSPRAMKAVALHELGHAFGLGHSLKETDIMRKAVPLRPINQNGLELMDTGWVANGLEACNLSKRDLSTMKIVYAAKKKLNEIRAKQMDTRNTCAELVNESVRQVNSGEYAEAIIYLREALRLDESFEVARGNLIATYYNCGVERYNRQEYAQALPLIEKALALCSSSGSSNRPQILTLEHNCKQALAQTSAITNASKLRP